MAVALLHADAFPEVCASCLSVSLQSKQGGAGEVWQQGLLMATPMVAMDQDRAHTLTGLGMPGGRSTFAAPTLSKGWWCTIDVTAVPTG